jgi:hypothetical protein
MILAKSGRGLYSPSVGEGESEGDVSRSKNLDVLDFSHYRNYRN